LTRKRRKRGPTSAEKRGHVPIDPHRAAIEGKRKVKPLSKGSSFEAVSDQGEGAGIKREKNCLSSRRTTGSPKRSSKVVCG